MKWIFIRERVVRLDEVKVEMKNHRLIDHRVEEVNDESNTVHLLLVILLPPTIAMMIVTVIPNQRKENDEKIHLVRILLAVINNQITILLR